MSDLATSLNADGHSVKINRDALALHLRQEGEDFFQLITQNCPYIFASVPLFVSSVQVEQMKAVISAVEKVVALPAWRDSVISTNDVVHRSSSVTQGVFFGYDFHLNGDGAHLIEINTNAGGAFLNNLLLQSQREGVMPGVAAASDQLEQDFLDMFLNEWRLERGDVPLKAVAIVDDHPQQQYLYPEFLLAQRMFERAGITAVIADPAELEVRGKSLYCQDHKIDLIYNRLTDFHFNQHAVLSSVFQNNELAVITPHPWVYALYADKYNLTRLTHIEALRTMGVEEADIVTLQARIPETRMVKAEDEVQWRHERKQWFFKPNSGFGSKGTYRGANVTHRVFAEIIKGGYVAQRMAAPGERTLEVSETESAVFKSDVRCYVYAGKVQLIAARLYQGQTTNFRTADGGFALVRIVD